MTKQIVRIIVAVALLAVFAQIGRTDGSNADKINALIVDGQNNHNWRETTPVMKSLLEESGRFTVDVATTPGEGENNDSFAPEWSQYGVVIMNYTGDSWSEPTKNSFEQYVGNGGGLVIFHAADNAFPDWEAYNKMIAVGGWGGRSEKSGPYLYLNDEGEVIRDMTPGHGGNHGPGWAFSIDLTAVSHPITDGLPKTFRHAADELYQELRGPAENVTILATAYADPKYAGTGRHEPQLMVIDYKKGRVFHIAYGHAGQQCKSVSFIVPFLRGTEWAATGEVTIPVPDDMPGPDEPTFRELLGYDPNATAQSLGLRPFVPPSGRFPLYPWDKQPGGWGEVPIENKEALQGVADCRFSIAGFVTTPEQIDICESLGIESIFGPLRFSVRTPSDEEIEAVVSEAAATTKDRKNVIGYFIIDEPGAKTFPYLGKVVAAVEKYAPGKLAYINLFPSYATTDSVTNPNSQLGTKSFTEYLERFVQEVKPQFISYDNYMVEYSDDMHEPNKRAVYFCDLLEIRRVALKYQLPFWNITGSNRIQTVTAPPSPARFAFQAFTTLAAGGKGLGWFTYYDVGEFIYSPIDNKGNKTITWLYQRAINEQTQTLGDLMLDFESTGVFFTSPLPADNVPGMPPLTPLPGRIVTEVKTTASLRGWIDETPAIMVGEFQSNSGEDYVMFVNLSLEHSANIRPGFANPNAAVEKVSSITKALQPFDQETGEWLLPGHGILVRIVNNEINR